MSATHTTKDSKFDTIGVVEAGYALDRTDDEWLNAINDAARPLLDVGLGTCTYVLSFDQAGRPAFSGLAAAGVARELTELVRMWHLTMDPEKMREIATHALVACSTSEAGGDAVVADDSPFARFFRPHGIRDVIGCTGVNDRSSIILTAPRSQVTRVTPAFRARWSRVAVHLAAALRLREALCGGSLLESLGADDAVLAPEGKILHAEGEATSRSARDRLRKAAVRIDRARGRNRVRDLEALDLWRGLVDGHWSMVDGFDTDGRRFVVARRNENRVEDPRGLTEREAQVAALVARGQPNKLVAYSLGLSTSTVATHLARVTRKLGIRSRVELVRLFGLAHH